MVAGTEIVPSPVCPVCCDSGAQPVGKKKGKYLQQSFDIYHCDLCGFSFVGNPVADFQMLYSDDYYAGKGADPLLDYVYELENPSKTIRVYEWGGILRAVTNLVPVTPQTTWLDYGCGNGGLVRFIREKHPCRITGYEEGSIRAKAAAAGISVLDRNELQFKENTFDIVTAIEVLEHAPDPPAILRDIRRLMKPGGLLFFTTGNAEPFRNNLLKWRYVVPEVHVSFFEPRTLDFALTRAGFRPEFRGFISGYENVIRYKVLKSLRIRRRSRFEQLLPWKILAKLVDWKLKVTGHPVGWAIQV